MSRSHAIGAALAVAAIALTACSGTDGGSGTAGSDRPGEKKSLTAPKSVILSANSTAQLGTVVIDGLGFTLYRFEQDSAEPSTTTCVDACATAWPPMLDESGQEPTLEQVDKEIVGSVRRPDGTTQVTIGGWPVYRHDADRAPGETAGHGKDAEWFAVTPKGGKAVEQ